MDLEKLRRRVEWSTRIAFVIFALVILSYVGKLWFLSGGELADDAEVWGQFGDYVGGLLNPLIAFLAFYWLTQSVLLQKQELSETRDALERTALAQGEQEKHSAKTARINALSALLASHNSDISSLRQEAQFLNGQLERIISAHATYIANGKRLTVQEAIEEIERINQEITNVSDMRRTVMEKISSLIDIESHPALRDH
jgi:hypothetical protein